MLNITRVKKPCFRSLKATVFIFSLDKNLDRIYNRALIKSSAKSKISIILQLLINELTTFNFVKFYGSFVPY